MEERRDRITALVFDGPGGMVTALGDVGQPVARGWLCVEIPDGGGDRLDLPVRFVGERARDVQ